MIKPTGKPVWSRYARIGDYGGATDKRDTKTEAIPYAWGVYRNLRAMRGSMYTQSTTSLVHVEHIAIARLFAALFRASEKLATNSIPSTAVDNLAEWAEIQAVKSYSGEEQWQLRQRVAARYQVVGIPTRTAVEDQVRTLLGDAFESIVWHEGGLLSTPPSPTIWPAGGGGSPTYDLGGGTWLSRRAHVTVYVVRDFALDNQEFDNLVQFQLRDMLNYALPAHCTYNWATTEGGAGFLIGISLIGYDAL